LTGGKKVGLHEYVVGVSHYWFVKTENPTQIKAALNSVGPISIAVGTMSSGSTYFDWIDY